MPNTLSAVVLRHLSGSKSGHIDEFACDSILIGRGTHNDIALDPFLDPTVSANHAEIRWEREGFVLYDMGSLNGTFLNGQSVRRALIQGGDEIGLGRRGPRFAFLTRESGEAPRTDPRPRVARSDLDRTSVEDVLEIPSAGPGPRMTPQRILIGIVLVLVVTVVVLLARLLGR
jgi:predicted component of type VI protein secretion system